MRFIKFAIVCATAAVVAACGAAAVVQNRQAEVAQSVAQNRAILTEINKFCVALMDDHALDPIRDKLELLRTPNSSPTPVVLLVIGDFANTQEKDAIMKWSAARDQCGARSRDFAATLSIPASVPTELQQRVRNGIIDFQNQAAQGVNYLIAGLYSGQMSYGEFNKQRSDLDSKVVAGTRAWLAAIDAEDKQNVAAQAQAAQQQVDAFVAILEAAACAKAKGNFEKAMCK
jgi:hypothetical protein